MVAFNVHLDFTPIWAATLVKCVLPAISAMVVLQLLDLKTLIKVVFHVLLVIGVLKDLSNQLLVH